MHAGKPRNVLDLLLRGVRFTKGDVAGDGIGEQERCLINHRQAGASYRAVAGSGGRRGSGYRLQSRQSGAESAPE